MLKWLEITPDYVCNNRCVGCFSVQDGDPDDAAAATASTENDERRAAQGASMSTREALASLSAGRQEGARWLWLGGGEPSLRKDLFFIAQAARRLGYERIKLQTNGMLLAYPDFAQRCAASGITEINFSIKGASAETHDRLTRTPGCHARMVAGMAEVRARGLAMEGDILLYRSNAAELPAMVAAYTALGVARYNLWLLSAAASDDEAVRREVPRIAEVMPHVVAAMDLRLSPRADFITSLHTPPCTVPESHAACRFHAPDLGLLISNPGGYRFLLEDSPIEGGTYFPGCDGCGERARCGGARADYVALHGEGEFRPIARSVSDEKSA